MTADSQRPCLPLHRRIPKHLRVLGLHLAKCLATPRPKKEAGWLSGQTLDGVPATPESLPRFS